jgi:signal transduction histidine kinase/PAS domain-containing protein
VTPDAFRSFADSLPEAMLLVSGDGTILAANRRLAECLQQAPEALVGTPLTALSVDEREAARLLEEWSRNSPLPPGTLTVRVGGEPIRFRAEGTVVEHVAQGGQRLLLVRLIPRRQAYEEADDLDEQLHALSEDRRRAEEERAGSAQRWQFLANASTALGSSLDVDQVLRTIARLSVPALADWCTVDMLEPDGSVRRVAVTHADPTKRDIVDMAATYPPDPQGNHPRTMVLRSGRSLLFSDFPEESLQHIASNERHLAALRSLAYRSAMIVAIKARGRTLGALTFATAESGRRYGPDDLALVEDLAHRAALAADNARLYAEAQEANRVKDEFLATVSHELRTPLSSMMNWIALLRQGKIGPEQVSRGLEVLQRSGEAQARLIDDILDVSRIVSGRLRLQPQPVELSDVVRDAVDTVRPAADAKRVRLEVADEAAGTRVLGDPARLQQVVWNLLSNGVKFTPEGGRVAVLVERNAQEARIVVTDTGEGISPEFLPFVFDRFRQAERVANRRHTGLGLGLAIVKHLVEAHGGSVEAQSEGRGSGATFVVRLPLVPR